MVFVENGWFKDDYYLYIQLVLFNKILDKCDNRE